MTRRAGVVPVALLILALLLAACGGDDPRDVIQGEPLLSTTFDDDAAWETGMFPTGADEPDSSLAVAEGRYRIDHRAGRSSSFIWGAGGEAYEDIVIEVEAEQLSRFDDNLYGVGCRLVTDDDGVSSGYMLLISGDGHFGIARLDGETLTFVLEWRQSDAIHEGRAQNTLRAICVEDYLALYANGEFLGDAADSTYRQPGQVGLVAGVNRENSVSVLFDDLAVYGAALED